MTGRPYPDPSPAGNVSKIFCNEVVSKAEELYPIFEEELITETFIYANSKVEEYNKQEGEVIISGNVTGKFSATGSFMICKDNKVFWMSICDSYFAHFDKNMNLKFISSGLCNPYAVINGEPRMVDRIESGSFNIDLDDRLFVFTDGFYHYVKDKDFLNLFLNFEDSLIERVVDFSKVKTPIDPDKFGHERSLIAVKI
ncbi:hypothetical protein KC872_03105 [Candidatus Kaiserbacteria bacterium]|nr:hypothetical protein [Candidatus Kaiserbacteria bacterium]